MKRKWNSQIFFLTLLFTLIISSCSSVPPPHDEKEWLSEGETIVPPEAQSFETPETKNQQTTQQVEPTQERPEKSEKPENREPQINPKQILSKYRVGKGDNISIKVFGEPDFSVTAHLSEEGTISYPFLGELQLAGLTVSQIEEKITRGLKKGYLVDPKVTLTVLEYRQLFLNGEVKSPGGYAFEPGMTVNKAVSLAGGFAETASRDEIFIIRDGSASVTPLPATLSSYVGPGDIIIIKEYKKFFVNGEVKQPGSYEFIAGMTVEKAISIAGGLGEYATRSWSRIYIIRDGDETQTPIRVDFKAPVYPGDIIKVNESPF
jgi:polysaccharide export outer membrane protein